MISRLKIYFCTYFVKSIKELNLEKSFQNQIRICDISNPESLIDVENPDGVGGSRSFPPSGDANNGIAGFNKSFLLSKLDAELDPVGINLIKYKHYIFLYKF